MFILNNHGVDICRTMNDGRPCFVIRCAHNTAFGNPGVLSNIKRGQFPIKSSDGKFLCVYVMAADHVKRDSFLGIAISKWVFKGICCHLVVGDDYLSPTADCFDRNCLGILLKPAVMAYHSLEEILCFETIY